GARECRSETVDPIAGRIGDRSGAGGHFGPSGVPVSVSNVPWPVLMLLASGTEETPSASPMLGPAGRGGLAATLQTRPRIVSAWVCPCEISATICGGMPHQVALAFAYFSIFP